MKYAPVLPLAIAVTLPLFGDPADDYVNLIRQIQADGTGQWDISDLESSGEATSYEGVGENGSDFELWSIYSLNGENYLLDTQFVAAYAPSATITIETLDPYPHIKRTRVDEGCKVIIDISGLVDPGNVTDDTPAAAQQAVFKHETYTFPDGVFSLEGDISADLVEQTYITGNGLYPANPGYKEYGETMIISGNLLKASGEEHFSVTALADFGVEEAEIEQQKIQVWPRTTAVISGLDGDTYYDSVPIVAITLHDVYPTSETWARVYPGRKTDNPDANEIIVLGDTYYPMLNRAVPEDEVSLSVSDLDVILTAEGEHTFEIVHKTPWGTEVLKFQEFSIDRTVEFKGNIISK